MFVGESDNLNSLTPDLNLILLFLGIINVPVHSPEASVTSAPLPVPGCVVIPEYSITFVLSDQIAKDSCLQNVVTSVLLKKAYTLVLGLSSSALK